MKKNAQPHKKEESGASTNTAHCDTSQSDCNCKTVSSFYIWYSARFGLTADNTVVLQLVGGGETGDEWHMTALEARLAGHQLLSLAKASEATERAMAKARGQ